MNNQIVNFYNGIEKYEIGINLTKDVEVLYSENYKTLPREIKDLNKWWDKYVHG